MRLVSIVSTLGICTLIFTWVVKLARGFSAFWATVAVGLFMASYRLTGAWFDIERLDMLFLFLSMLGLLLASKSLSPNLSEKSRPLFTIAAALVLLFAFMTKQQAILFVIGGFFAYCHSRAKRLSMLFLGTFLTSAVTWVFIADQTTGGGFSYYCFKVPAGNGIQLSLAKVFLVTDLPVIAPLILPALFGTIAISKHYPRRDNIQGIFLAWGTVSAFIGSILSRAHWGGDQNVLIPFYLFAIIWACIICSGVEYRTRQQSILVSLVCLLQFGIFAYRPQAQLPTVSQETAHSAYTQLIQDLEKNGEVLCVDHGNMTKAPHFHILGLLDVYHASKGLPEVVHEAIAGKKYAAIVVDAEDGLSGLVPDVSTYYTRKHRQGLESSWTVTGFQTPVSGRAVWVYLP